MAFARFLSGQRSGPVVGYPGLPQLVDPLCGDPLGAHKNGARSVHGAVVALAARPVHRVTHEVTLIGRLWQQVDPEQRAAFHGIHLNSEAGEDGAAPYGDAGQVHEPRGRALAQGELHVGELFVR